MADRKPPPPDDALSSLRRRVEAAQDRNAPPSEAPPSSASSLALKMGGEFGAAIVVGALLGFGADHFLHTGSWGLGIGLALGFAAGVMNVVRAARIYSAGQPPAAASASPPADDDED